MKININRVGKKPSELQKMFSRVTQWSCGLHDEGQSIREKGEEKRVAAHQKNVTRTNNKPSPEQEVK